MKTILLVWFLGWGLAASWPAGAKKPSDEERLLSGDILISFKENPKSKVHDVQGEILLDADPSLIWAVLTDYKNWTVIFPDLAGCEILDHHTTSARLKVWINNLWPYPDYNLILQVIEDPGTGTLSWDMIEGNLKSFSGAATIKTFSRDLAKTHLIFLFTREQGWFVPKVNNDLDNRSLVVNRLLALRKEVRTRKKAQEGNGSDNKIKPKWWKGPFWWEQKPEAKDKTKDPPPAEDKREQPPNRNRR